MKTDEIEKIGDTIIADYGKSDFTDLINRLSYDNGIVVQVFDQNGALQTSSSIFGDQGPSSMNPQTLSNITARLSKSHSRKTSYIATDPRLNGQILIYGALLANTPGGLLYLYINSQIAPVDSTTAVLKNQLMIVTVISLLLSLLISLLIASKLSRPITKLTQSAAKFAGGDYHVHFEPGNYAKISQLAATLNYATNELSKTDELRRELVANISHDLRTPLTMVKMYAELIRDVSGENADKRDAHTRVIIEESDRLSALITDMLDLSRLQSGTAQMELNKFDLGEKTRAILNRFQALAERDGYVFDIRFDPDVVVCADEQKIEQVIYNLVSNAVNYTGEDKKVTIRVKKSGPRARFEVTDTGKGIPEEKLEQIWERYYKAKETHKRAVVGTGLGLSIVKGILESHNADYGVKSAPGRGSTFWFEL